MNIASNPWSFVPADLNTAAIAASPGGLVLNADGSVTLTLAAPLSNGDLVIDNKLTIFEPDDPAFRGFYKVYKATSSTIYTIVPINFVIPPGTAAAGGGTAAQNQYADNTRIEDMSWQNPDALGQILVVVDRNGFPIWEATAAGPGSQNRGKVFWVSGLTLIQMDAGILLATVN